MTNTWARLCQNAPNASDATRANDTDQIQIQILNHIANGGGIVQQ